MSLRKPALNDSGQAERGVAEFAVTMQLPQQLTQHHVFLAETNTKAKCISHPSGT